MKFKRPKQPLVKSKAKPNPFEIHRNRSKHDVLGRKLKSDSGMPGISRHKALKKRKETLFHDYKMRNKSNQFLDKRIGERNSHMTEEDIIMARFTKERMKMFNKKTRFNLSDSEVLTHKGQTLSEIETFEDIRSDDEDEEETGKSGVLKGKFVEEAHFGGMLTKSKHNRESLIEQLIVESKKRKVERQKNKEETLEATEKLDEEWKILGQLTTSANACEPLDVNNKKIKEDNYDFVMRQLKFEPHGQASQRLKTEEEIIKDDREKLEKLEHERLKQLREIDAQKSGYHRSSDDIDDGFANLTNSYPADDDSASSDDDDDAKSDCEATFTDENQEELVDEKDESQEGAEREISEEDCSSNDNDGSIGDAKSDCEAIFTEENQEELVNEKKESQECAEQEISEEDCSSNDNDGSIGESDESSDEECAMEDLGDLMPSISGSNDECNKDINLLDNKIVKVKNDDNLTTSAVDLDLPYILDVPKDLDTFINLMKKYSAEKQNIIFERLLKSNHPNLGPENKKKILKLTDYIVQYVRLGDLSFDSFSSILINFNIFKDFNAEESLNMLVENLSAMIDNFDSTPSEQTIKYLLWYILLFLKPHGMDVLLGMNKPALNILCKTISQVDMSSNSQLTVGVLSCFCLLQDSISSGLVYPEAIMFLENCLKKSSNFFIKSADKKEKQNKSNTWKLPLTNLQDIQSNLLDSKVLYVCIKILIGFVRAYRKYPQSKFLFKNINNIIKQLKERQYEQAIVEAIEELHSLLSILQSVSLSAVVRAAKKPKSLRQYEPSFGVVTEGKRSLRGLSEDKREEQKLLHKYKTERRGAIRELRRDRSFLANVKIGEKLRDDAVRIKKVKEIFGSAAAQQGELKSLQRKKR